MHGFCRPDVFWITIIALQAEASLDAISTILEGIGLTQQLASM